MPSHVARTAQNASNAATPLDGPGTFPTIVRFTLLFMLVCGITYPLVTTAVDGALFPYQANGSLIRQNGRIVGSELVGQPFHGAGYFFGRPSASNDHALTMTASNLAVSNPALRRRARATSLAIQRREHVPANRIPVGLISASGSGIDPDISPASAQLEAPLVARARGLPLETVKRMIAHATHTGPLGLGQPGVNVLELNLALDAATAKPRRPATP